MGSFPCIVDFLKRPGNRDSGLLREMLPCFIPSLYLGSIVSNHPALLTTSWVGRGVLVYLYCFYIFFAILCSLWDPSSLTKDPTCALGSESIES